MGDKKLYTSDEVAKIAGVRRETILRWCRAGKIPEPDRDRNNWRMFTEAELKAAIRYANKITPAPRKRQTTLTLRGA